MKKYLSFFKIRFINGLQYRTAAWAGVATQFAWGGMLLVMFWAFYKANAVAFPMPFDKLASYIWLQQALMTLFAAWYFDNDIFDAITSGNIAYELCRPSDLYQMWFVKNMATRVARAALRSMPILIVAVFLPKPFCISLPDSPIAGLCFLISLVLAFLVIISFIMLLYISAFYTLSPLGIRILASSVIEFFSGAVIPLPFFPKNLLTVVNLLPFAAMQNTPLQIYNGYYTNNQIVQTMLLQIFWFSVLVLIGRVLMKNALRHVVAQGG